MLRNYHDKPLHVTRSGCWFFDPNTSTLTDGSWPFLSAFFFLFLVHPFTVALFFFWYFIFGSVYTTSYKVQKPPGLDHHFWLFCFGRPSRTGRPTNQICIPSIIGISSRLPSRLAAIWPPTYGSLYKEGTGRPLTCRDTLDLKVRSSTYIRW